MRQYPPSARPLDQGHDIGDPRPAEHGDGDVRADGAGREADIGHLLEPVDDVVFCLMDKHIRVQGASLPTLDRLALFAAQP
jgi:hypothetical protein